MKKYLLILLATLAFSVKAWATWDIWSGDVYYKLYGSGWAEVAKPDNWYGKVTNRATIMDVIYHEGYGFTVTTIGEDAFRNCPNLQIVTIGENINEVDANAFTGCDEIHTVYYNARDLKSMCRTHGFLYSVFEDSHETLTTVEFGYFVQRIPAYGFAGLDHLTSISLPNTVQEIEDGAFYSCPALNYVEIDTPIPPEVGANSFDNPSSIYLKVPYGGRENYRNHPIWGQFHFVENETPVAITTQGNRLFYLLDETNHTATVVFPFHHGGWENETNKPSGSVVIPNAVQFDNVTYDVTAIGERAFSGCPNITSVTIGTNIQTIAPSAFKGCAKIATVNFNAINCTSMRGLGVWSVFDDSVDVLTTLNIGNSVTRIPDHAFAYCLKINSLTLPPSVVRIGEKAFFGCSSIPGTITIPSSIELLGKSAFSNCIGITAVSIDIPTIPEEAFSHCSELTSVTLGPNVHVIGKKAFQSCSKLTAFTIPSSVHTFEPYAFWGCSRLSGTFTIPSTLTTIDVGAMGYTGITGSLTIPSTVTTLGSQAFCSCEGLTSVTINLPQVPSYLFQDCTGLNTVTIGPNVTHVGDFVFRGCTNISTVNFNAYYCSKMHYADDYTYRDYSAFYDSKSVLTTLNIGDNVNWIPPYAFFYCYRLSTLNFPASVKMVGDGAFGYCYGLTGPLTIPNTIESLGNSVFLNCKNLTTVSINTSTIPAHTFNQCKALTTVTIGPNVTLIGNRAFAYCDQITTVHFNAVNCTKMIFDDEYGYNKSSTFNHSTKTLTNLTIGNQVTRIPDYAFVSCNHITSLTIPASVSEIGQRAFYYCSGLKNNLIIPSTVTSLGDWAFACCSGLPSVSVNVPSIGSCTFYECYGLTSVTIGHDVTEIDGRAFQECDHIATVNFNASNCASMKGPTYGNTSVFSYSYQTLSTVNFGNEVTQIPDYAFSGCGKISSIHIPSGVTRIGNSAFSSHVVALIEVDRTTPPTVYGNSFIYSNNTLLRVPSSSLSLYRDHEYWGRFLMASEVVVAGVMVTESNAGNITGNGIEGSVSYDFDSHKLTLNNATITVNGKNAINHWRQNMIINLVGTNTITATNADALNLQGLTTIEGTGSLNVTSSNNAINAGYSLVVQGGCTVTATGGNSIDFCSIHGTNGATFMVADSKVTATRGGSNYGSIGGFSYATLNNCIVTQPFGTVWNETNHRFENPSGTVVTNQIVIDNPEYDLWVENNRVTASNVYDVLGDGTVSYNIVTQTLTLNNATLNPSTGEAIRNELSDLTIHLIGTNSITADHGTAVYSTGDLTFTGDGSLFVNCRYNGIQTDGNLTLQSGCNVDVNTMGVGGYSAFNGSTLSTLIVNHSRLRAEAPYSSKAAIFGYATVSVNGSRFDTPTFPITWNTYNHLYEYQDEHGQNVRYKGTVVIDCQTYDLSVAGITVTSGNAANIVGTGITGGTVSYDPTTNELTLNDATINGGSSVGIFNEIPDLKIVLIGDNTITSNSTGIKSNEQDFSVEGRGTLSVTGEDGIHAYNCNLTIQGGCSVLAHSTRSGNYAGIKGSSSFVLTISQSSVTASNTSTLRCSLTGFETLELEGVSFTQPADGDFHDHAVFSNGSIYRGQVVISPDPYRLWVQGVQVTSFNADDVLGDGTVSYNAFDHILTLDGASITNSSNSDGIANEIDGLTILLKGNNTINVTDDGINSDGHPFTITGRGSLDITAPYGIYCYANNSSLTVADGCSVNVTSYYHGVRLYGGPLIVRNAELKASGSYYGSISCNSLTCEGCSITSPEGAEWNSSSLYVEDENGAIKTQIVISPINYNITVANIAVTSANASDVLGDGKVYYDVEDNVLTLNEASIVCNYNGIQTYVDGLTIKLIGDNVITSGPDGINISTSAYNTSIVGPGTLTVNSKYAIRCGLSNYTLTIAEGAKVVLNGSNSGVRMANCTLVVDCAELWAKGSSEVSVACHNLIMERTSITFPAGAVFNQSVNGVVGSAGSSTVYNGNYVKITPDLYDLWISGVRLSAANADHFTENVISGTVQYDWEEGTLYLYNATINYDEAGEPVIFSDGLSYLNIDLTGDNYLIGNEGEGCFAIVLEGEEEENTLSIWGPGSLNANADVKLSSFWDVYIQDCPFSIGEEGSFYSPNGAYNGYNLHLDGATLSAYSVYGMGYDGRLYGGQVMQPEDAYFDEQAGAVLYQGNLATEVVIGSELNLWVAGTRVNSLNADYITGEGISGNVSFDVYSNTLTLNNATIVTENEGIHYSGSSYINIRLVGDNTILSDGETGIFTSQTARIKGTGSLLTSGTNGIICEGALVFEDGCTVEAIGTSEEGAGISGLTNKTLTVYGGVTLRASTYASSNKSSIYGFNRLDLSHVEILQPANGSYNNTYHRFEDADGNRFTGIVEIGSDEYDLWIGGTRVTSANINLLSNLPCVTSGGVYFNRSRNTLTLNNATLNCGHENGITSQIDGLTIELAGTNTISTEENGIYVTDASTTIKGTGTLNVYSNQMGICASLMDDKLISIEDCTIHVEDENNLCVCTDGVLRVTDAVLNMTSNFAILRATGLMLDYVEISTPDGAWYDESFHMIKDAQGDEAIGTVIIEPIPYELFVAGVQVTAANASDVLGDGTVSYDDLQKRLVLNGADLFNDDVDYGIKSYLPELTIELMGDNTILAYQEGIYLYGDATLTGLGTLRIDANIGIFAYPTNDVYPSLTLEGGCDISIYSAYKALSLANSINQTGGVLTVNASTLKAYGVDDVKANVFCSALNLIGANITSPVGGILDGYQIVQPNHSIPESVVIEPVKYNLWIAGTQVTTVNADDVYGDATVSYNAIDNILTLHNANIFDEISDHGILTKIADLNIVLEGDNVINSYEDGLALYADATITGTGTLQIYAPYGIYTYPANDNYPSLTLKDGCSVFIESMTTGVFIGEGLGMTGGVLTVERATLEVEMEENGSDDAISCLDLQLKYAEITTPEGAYFNQYIVFDANGDVADHVVIEPAEYDLWVEGVQVHALNAFDVLGDGTVSYDADEHVLTLNDASISYYGEDEYSGIDNGISDLKIALQGNNTIVSAKTGIVSDSDNLCIQGSGTLTITAEQDGITLHGSSLNIQGGCSVNATTNGSDYAGIFCDRYADESLTIVRSSLTAQSPSTRNSAISGFASAILDGCEITSPENGCYYNGEICTSSLQVYRGIVVIEPFKYELWVSGTQVNSANAPDVLGDGTVSYDAEQNILTLNGAAINYQEEDTQGGIQNGIADLHIELVGNNTIVSGQSGIYSNVNGTTIQGEGSLTITADHDGIYLLGCGLTIQGGCSVNANTTSSSYVGIYCERYADDALVVDRSSLTAQTPSTRYSAINGFASIVFTGVEFISPANGCYFNGNVCTSTHQVYHDQVVISGTPCGLWIAGVPVTTTNASNITGTGISGSVSYDVKTATLMLNNASIMCAEVEGRPDGILSTIEGLKIQLEGDNSIVVASNGIKILSEVPEIETSILGPGTLTISADCGIFSESTGLVMSVSETAKVTIDAISEGVNLEDGTVDVDMAELWVKGGTQSVLCAMLTMTGTSITSPNGAVFSALDGGVVESEGSHNLVHNQYVKITPETYNLAVAGTQVTIFNASNILGDGSASFNAANSTLMLVGADVDNRGEYGIFSGIDGLNIMLIGTNYMSSGEDGISLYEDAVIRGAGKLNIDAPFGIWGYDEYGSYPNLTLEGGCDVTVNSTDTGISLGTTGTLSIDSATLHMTGVDEAIATSSANQLVIYEGGQLYCNGTNTYATFHKNIAKTTSDADGWHLIAAPMNNPSIANLTANTYDVYAYDEDANRNEWKNYRQGSFSFVPGDGYLYANSAATGEDNTNLVMSGVLVPSNQTVTVNLSYGAVNGDIRGYNLIGNPYPHSLRMSDVKIDGEAITEFYRLVDGTHFVSCTSGDIQPGEAFFVKATSAGQVLTIGL